MSRHFVSLRSLLLLLSLGLLAAPAAHAAINGACVDDVTATIAANQVPNNCTANDVTFVLVGLGIQTDGCVSGNSGENLSIRMRAILRNTTASTRYDVGMYIATDGDPNGDGAITGACYREDIASVLQGPGGVPVTTCGATGIDLDGPLSGVDRNVVGVGDGPYLSAEVVSNNSTPDSCGDLYSTGRTGCDENGDGLWDDTVLDFTTPVTLPCRDTEGNGFANIPTCATWGQQPDEVNGGNNKTCDGEAEVIPGTKAKCRCENVDSNIPMPSLSCTSSCTPSTIQPGQTTTCTVNVVNSASCVPNGATSERFRCGTAGYMRYKTDLTNEFVNGANYGAFGGEGGSGAGLVQQCNGAACVNAGAPSFVNRDGVNGADRIVWNVESSSARTPGLMGPNGDSGTLTFTYTLDPSFDTSSGPANLSFSTTGYWSDVSNFSPEVAQSTLTCGAVVTTPVTLDSFHAVREGDRVTVEWTTGTEVSTAGFFLYEELSDGWRRVESDLIAARAVNTTAPQGYRMTFDSLSGEVGGTGRLYLESVDVDGSKRLFGPFRVGEKRGIQRRPLPLDWQAVRAQAAEDVRAQEGRGLALRKGPAAAVAVDLLVTETGLHRVTYEDLAAAGFDLSAVQAAHLAVTHRGEAVPVRVVTASGNRFGPGSFLELYAEGLDTLYTGTNVYQLSVDPSSARRVAVDRRAGRGSAPSYFPGEVRVERERYYSFGSPTDDPWYDTSMLAYGGPGSWSFPFEVEGYVAGAAPAVLQVNLWGVTLWPAAPDHHVTVALNGTPLADELFDGRVGHTIQVELPEGVLREGSNTLTLGLPNDLGVDFDLVSADGFFVMYPNRPDGGDGRLAFSPPASAQPWGRMEVPGLGSSDVVAYRLEAGGDVTYLAGAEITASGGAYTASLRAADGASYALSEVSALLRPELRPITAPADIEAGEAELLVISHPAFLGALAPWTAAREAEGRQVRVVTVDDVFRVYGYGIFDPQAIRDYIAHAARQMGTREVMLVGGDTFDYRDYLGIGSMSFVPSLYADTGGTITFAPVDPLYADIDGDRVPDLPIGRLPVRSAAELEDLLARGAEYRDKGYERTSLLVADAFDLPTRFSFSQASDAFFDGLGEGWEARKAYLDNLALADAKAELIAALEDGVALTCFSGHSGPAAWTFDGLFTTQDARNLANAGRPTVMVQWGCWNSYYVEPRYETLAHTLLLSENRGAAALVGATALFDTTLSDELGRRLAERLGEPGTSLGDAMTETRRELAEEKPELRGALLGWVLLGDPTLAVEN